jgi:histidinol-phosphate aminotransferase
MLDWNTLTPAAQQSALARPAQANPERSADVARLIAQVRADGDDTVRALTRKFDGAALTSFAVTAAEFAACEAQLTEPLKAAMRAAYGRLNAFHAASAPKACAVETAPGVLCERIPIGIERVGLYVPAGSAPLPSTALMLGVPAQLAGCKQLLLCSPPNELGAVHPSVLYAAQLCGIHQVYKIGGVQAIAAMAFGTQSVPKCDKIFGPGNGWVTEAKQQVSQCPDGAAIDMPAGPSEVLVIADEYARADIVAADLLSQAEHGPDSQVILLSPSAPLLTQVQKELTRQLAALGRAEIAAAALAHARLIKTSDLPQAFEISNRYAPEHLIINAVHPRNYLELVINAGSIFLGALTPESTGDYNAGTNHVLPTYGYARAYSGVSVASFVKLVTVQTLSAQGLANIGPEAVVFARAEGLEAHAQAVQKRLDLLDPTLNECATALQLARPEFAQFKGYSSARMEASHGATFLNANESPFDTLADDTDELNRYPAPQPPALVKALAEIYGVAANQLLIGRGSDEPIDLLTRAFCRAGVDRVLIMPPTFGMYKVCAELQGAAVVEVPLRAERNFAPDWQAASVMLAGSVKLAYVCTPNNPTGGEVDRAELIEFVQAARGRTIVVIDEAYAEFSEQQSATALLAQFEHVVILRTLSKAYGLAGARLGVAIARPELIALLRRLQAPYPIPTPVSNLALRVLADRGAIAANVALLKAERDRIALALSALPGVIKVWPSVANFLTFSIGDAKAVYAGLRERGVIVRDVAHYIGLANHLRASVGTQSENDLFLSALTQTLQAI